VRPDVIVYRANDDTAEHSGGQTQSSVASRSHCPRRDRSYAISRPVDCIFHIERVRDPHDPCGRRARFIDAIHHRARAGARTRNARAERARGRQPSNLLRGGVLNLHNLANFRTPKKLYGGNRGGHKMPGGKLRRLREYFAISRGIPRWRSTRHRFRPPGSDRAHSRGILFSRAPFFDVQPKAAEERIPGMAGASRRGAASGHLPAGIPEFACAQEANRSPGFPRRRDRQNAKQTTMTATRTRPSTNRSRGPFLPHPRRDGRITGSRQNRRLSR